MKHQLLATAVVLTGFLAACESSSNEAPTDDFEIPSIPAQNDRLEEFNAKIESTKDMHEAACQAAGGTVGRATTAISGWSARITTPCAVDGETRLLEAHVSG